VLAFGSIWRHSCATYCIRKKKSSDVNKEVNTRREFNPALDNENGFLNTRQACAYLGISMRQLFRLKNEYGVIKFYQHNKTVRFKKEDLDAYMQEFQMLPFNATEGTLSK
jgi:excisionase family DNA binding protein